MPTPQEQLGIDIWDAIKTYNEDEGSPQSDPEMEAFWGAVADPFFTTFEPKGASDIAVVDVGTIVSLTYSIDPSNKLIKMTLGLPILAITLTIPAKPGRGYFRIKQGPGGLSSVAFINAKFAGGTPPVIATGANQVTLLEFFYDTDAWVLTDQVNNVA